MLLHTITLPINLTNANEGRTMHFAVAAQRRKKIFRQLQALGLRRRPFDQPVDVVVTRILGSGQRLMDSSSLLRGNWKEIEDSLVQLGWFADDGPKYIRATLALQDSSNRAAGPAIAIDIYTAGTIQLGAQE